MSRKILVDALYSDEIRLVVLGGDTVEAFEYQSAAKKSIKGNIYLAKVTRIEPSLQAAFVSYGNEKQGFLPFDDIHCDYYQIPASDKKELMNSLKTGKSGDDNTEAAPCHISETDVLIKPVLNHRYKIQEVIKKDQVLLVQVLKEERGNKGATLTTYISLAGRYCVLMPNASRSIGISRKVTDINERERLKALAYELHEQNNNLSLVIRTAGEYRAKADIKKDFSYLKKLWSNIRANTLSATAPAFIHEEGDIVRKSIRDFYSVEVDEIVVSGEAVYNNALEFMQGILPKYVAKLKLYSDTLPIFTKYNVEEQLANLYDNKAPLKSGGYVVINQAEALVAIDVNSGKSTAERNVENTALKTNLEAATEIARQLRLRDLSGLIVIDFIDMSEFDHRKAVESAFKDATSNDKARIQIGKISEFGLLEMSRQHLKQSFAETHLLEGSYCSEKGEVRPLDATSIAILRAIESEIASNPSPILDILASKELAMYFTNTKRKELAAIEKSANVKIRVQIDESGGADGFFIEGNALPAKQAGAMSVLDYNTSHIENDSFDATAKRQRNENSQKSNKHQNNKRSNNQGSQHQNQNNKKHTEQKVAERVDIMPAESSAAAQASNNNHHGGTMHDSDQRREKKRKFVPRNQNNNVQRNRTHHDDALGHNNRQSDQHKRTEDSSLLKKIWKKIIK